jgi:hypothetical protein
MKRYLKDWSITKQLTLDRSEWKVVIHVREPRSLVPPLLLSFNVTFFIRYFSLFCISLFLFALSPFSVKLFSFFFTFVLSLFF